MQAIKRHGRGLSLAKFAALAALMIAVPGIALAQGQPWESTASNTYNLIMSVVRYVAIIGIVACGLAAFFGKLSWDWAGKIIIGLVLVFGAQQLVDYFRSAMGN
ncbi:hypothetical protein TB15x_20635 [Xanthomonas perforans]|uniref:TrbC/VirB2 family protein n=2 Tax=Xanthomonas TaxID=338 RepID=UPI00062D7F8A|nr:TrbC/VirB2 family protein [Xanthomonas perforans]KLD35827.1 hypothetical protein TB15x_20635 [Xanthomonas perforans]MBZ2436249.1 TrbC/VirB2 family protein [Xanthomonas perforans]MBZ2461361.1 TrbC/VirB2 family protein [Xanthomonas perforans]MBZ2482787.1 TrbC/VirB2 family protein [Xanthomonas perforans]MBZ2491355.1 TrbC/VirB2 family protein [Xanthomonas perforans]